MTEETNKEFRNGFSFSVRERKRKRGSLKKTFLFVLITLTFIENSCFEYMGPYQFITSITSPKESSTLAYSDEFFSISFVIERTQINFTINNLTDAGIKINWDDLAFIDTSKRSMRVVHAGIKLRRLDEPQMPTTVPPHSSINDVLIPSNNISWGKDYSITYPLFYFYGPIAKAKQVYVGKEFSVYMPLEIKGQKKEYVFRFKIEDLK